MLPEPLEPWPALILAQAIFEEQLQVVVVRLLHAVVESLVIVGVGARFEQEPRELDPMLMRRLPQRPFATTRVVLAQAEHSRQRGKDVAPLPQEARVRAGAGCEQELATSNVECPSASLSSREYPA